MDMLHPSVALRRLADKEQNHSEWPGYVVLDDSPALPNWPSLIVSDARDVYDHMRKEGSSGVPEQRAILLELEEFKDDVMSGRISVAWTATENMLADGLTKVIPDAPAHIRRVLLGGSWSTQGYHDLVNPAVASKQAAAKQQRQRAKQKPDARTEQATLDVRAHHTGPDGQAAAFLALPRAATTTTPQEPASSANQVQRHQVQTAVPDSTAPSERGRTRHTFVKQPQPLKSCLKKRTP